MPEIGERHEVRSKNGRTVFLLREWRDLPAGGQAWCFEGWNPEDATPAVYAAPADADPDDPKVYAIVLGMAHWTPAPAAEPEAVP